MAPQPGAQPLELALERVALSCNGLPVLPLSGHFHALAHIRKRDGADKPAGAFHAMRRPRRLLDIASIERLTQRRVQQ